MYIIIVYHAENRIASSLVALEYIVYSPVIISSTDDYCTSSDAAVFLHSAKLVNEATPIRASILTVRYWGTGLRRP